MEMIYSSAAVPKDFVNKTKLRKQGRQIFTNLMYFDINYVSWKPVRLRLPFLKVKYISFQPTHFSLELQPEGDCWLLTIPCTMMAEDLQNVEFILLILWISTCKKRKKKTCVFVLRGLQCVVKASTSDL